jgi:hypothetical protein
MRLTFLLCLLPGTLAAQATDTTRVAHSIPVTDSVLRLPVDHPSDLLSWMPGGGLDPDGAPSWHAFQARNLDHLIDGVRWANALRSTGNRGNGATPVLLEPDFNAIDHAELSSSARGPASFLFSTLGGGDQWRVEGSGEGEAFLRREGGTGISRFEGAVGGPLLGSFRARASGTLTGRRSAPTGIDYTTSPFYVPSGIDTTMRYADPSSLPDSIDAGVQRFSATSSVPFSPQSTADWALRIDGRVGKATLWGHWLGTRLAERFFTYADVANPLQARGADRSGRDVAAGILLPLTSRTRLEGSLSLQHDRSEEGPLSSAGELDSRDPALGLMLDGVDLRFDLDNFPVDGQLVTNYRHNTPGSRRSPYDLENTAQYALIDQYRNNAYGLLGWSEAGGPVGTLALDQDSRIAATAAMVTALGDASSLRIGVEVVRHDMQHYSHGLVSQAFSDVWREQPTEDALTADWAWHGTGWRVGAGARIDRFQTGASRPWLRDTVSGSPTVGRYQYFPRISSYGSFDPALIHFVPDAAHTAVAPRLVVDGDLDDGLTLHLSVIRTARMPDLENVLQGVNTDRNITSNGYSFGTDIGHEIIDLYEVELRKAFGTLQVGATLFNDDFRRVAVPGADGIYDAARGSFDVVGVTLLRNGGSFRGVTLSGDWKAAPWLTAHGTYTYSDTGSAGPFYNLALGGVGNFRPHTFALNALLTPSRSVGALVSYRRMSGSARPVDPGSLPSFFPGDARVEDLPAWSSLDLRLSKDLAVGPQHLSLYLDARNLLNAANLVRAFRSGDPTHFANNEDIAWANDSSAYGDEARRSGRYDDPTGNIDLTFGGAGRGGCGSWQTASGQQSPVNCAYLIAAEQRFGDGDGVYTLTEQRAASRAYYLTQYGRSAFTAPGMSVRIGAQVAF